MQDLVISLEFVVFEDLLMKITIANVRTSSSVSSKLEKSLKIAFYRFFLIIGMQCTFNIGLHIKMISYVIILLFVFFFFSLEKKTKNS